MSGKHRLWSRTLCVAAAVLLIHCSAPAAWGAQPSSGANAMEWYVTQDAVLVYVRHSGQNQSAEAQVGTQSAAGAVVTGADGDIPVVTWLLVDNSLSIGETDRAKIKQLLTDLVAGGAPGERFHLCTFGAGLNVILRDSRNYAELKSQIDSIEHGNQYAFLVDALADILNEEDAREGQEFVRIVVISDGMDVNPEGLTKDELTLRLRERNIPIYTLGCKRDGNEQALKEMYSLSRLTNAKSWPLTGLEDTLAVSRELSGAELPVCVQVTIPEAMRDGAPRGVQITFSDGAVVELTATMPFGSVTPVETPAPAPSPRPDPTSAPVPGPEPDPGPSPVLKLLPWIALAVCVLAAAGVSCYVLLRRKREAERIKPVVEDELLPGADDTFVQDEEDDGGTVLLMTSERLITLSLTDRANPSRHFAVPLQGRVSIGRTSANQIVLDYDRSVSGRHCEIYLDGITFRIRDLNSRNGTYVDGIQVVDAAEISNGSIIKLGRLELLVEVR